MRNVKLSVWGKGRNAEFWKVIGYLSTWGITPDKVVSEDNYPIVVIEENERGEIHASYCDKDNNQKFYMMAIRDASGEYSTHS